MQLLRPSVRPWFSGPIGAALASLVLTPCALRAAHPPQAVAISRWLVLGPVPARTPAFAAVTDSALLAASRLPMTHAWPAPGAKVDWLDGRATAWAERAAPQGTLQIASSPGSSVVFAVAYVDADRWSRARLTIDASGGTRRVVSLDGARVTGDTVTLPRGKHLLLVQAIQPAAAALTLSARLEPITPGAEISVTLDPRHPPTLDELMATTEVRDIAVDPTGKKVAWVARKVDKDNDRYTNIIEVHDLTSGRLVAQLNATDAAAPRWSRDGTQLAFVSATDKTGAPAGGRDLWVWDAARGESARVLRGERGLGDLEWSANGAWLYFTAATRIGERETFKPGDVQRLSEVWQRWTYWPEKAQLYALDVREGTRLKLVGDTLYSVEGARLSPDGRTMVFARSVRTNAERPWLRAEIWLLDLADLSTRKLLDLAHEAFGAPTEFAWSPDGRAIAFCASAEETLQGRDSTFSVYENELYATTVEHPALVRLSAGFVPAVSCNRELFWNSRDQRIYVTADAGARTVPARTAGPVPSSLDRHPPLEVMRIPGEDVTAYGFAPSALVAAIQTPTTAAVVYRIPLGAATGAVDGSPAVLDRPSDGALPSTVAMPTWRPWEFTNTKGAKIEAWYWLPPGFDSTRTYPMIVHYYGGTLPMKKSFDQRLLWFAGQGYVVFMLNPSGAPGYGQAFANLHVNDWGYPAATDVIEGVEQFERTHSFVDARHVGNFGHSYGGFMTMHLATRTAMFAGSIAIAGISNIADYWGAGGTGYSYTEGTCRGCYPWNRKDIYVDRSPLFQADKIRTPMLLIHGTDDTNVVPTESEQMFTALRMLGREAELVRFYGENHGINSRPSVTRSLYGVMLDWYDKQIRGQRDAWDARWTRTPNAATARTDAVSLLQP